MSLIERPITETAAESPFLSGTSLQYAWDSVSLTAAMSCWRRYYYQIILGLRPRASGRAIALDFGIAFHKALEHYHNFHLTLPHDEAVRATVLAMTADPHYARLPSQDDLEAEVAATPEDDDGIYTRNAKVRTRYHLMRAVIWYLTNYAEDTLHTITLPSGAAAVELSFRMPLPITVSGHDMILSGHLDRAVEFNDSYYIADYKTSKSISRQFFETFELSHQLTGYSIAGSVVLDSPIAGIIIDGIALQVGGCQFARKPTKRSGGQIAEYLETVQDTMLEAERHADSGLYPMNTSACYFCEFKSACSTAPEYRQAYLDTYYEPGHAWNPLENR